MDCLLSSPLEICCKISSHFVISVLFFFLNGKNTDFTVALALAVREKLRGVKGAIKKKGKLCPHPHCSPRRLPFDS